MRVKACLPGKLMVFRATISGQGHQMDEVTGFGTTDSPRDRQSITVKAQ